MSGLCTMTKYETSSMLFTQALKTLLRSFWAEFACGSFLCGVPIFVWVHVYKYKVGCCNQNRVLICVSDYYQILWQNIYSPSHTPPSNTPTSTLSLPGEWSYSLVSGYAQAMLHCITNHLLDIIPSSHLYPLGC